MIVNKSHNTNETAMDFDKNHQIDSYKRILLKYYATERFCAFAIYKNILNSVTYGKHINNRLMTISAKKCTPQ